MITSQMWALDRNRWKFDFPVSKLSDDTQPQLLIENGDDDDDDDG